MGEVQEREGAGRGFEKLQLSRHHETHAFIKISKSYVAGFLGKEIQRVVRKSCRWRLNTKHSTFAQGDIDISLALIWPILKFEGGCNCQETAVSARST